MEKVGVDANPAVIDYANEDVTVHVTDDLSLPTLPDDHFDLVFISNFLEHLPKPSDVVSLLERTRSLLRPGGRVMILQPNYRLLGAAYFDFIDHTVVLTDQSLREALDLSGLETETAIVRFLPYTTKSRLPQHPQLVRWYLRLPPLWLIFGGQSLFVARKPSIRPKDS